eukprot:m.341717 g.341717  ORF g.341717 m.341717 type:complete len:625 (+) comp55773_c1_seq1:716-2590(+)
MKHDLARSKHGIAYKPDAATRSTFALQPIHDSRIHLDLCVSVEDRAMTSVEHRRILQHNHRCCRCCHSITTLKETGAGSSERRFEGSSILALCVRQNALALESSAAVHHNAPHLRACDFVCCLSGPFRQRDGRAPEPGSFSSSFVVVVWCGLVGASGKVDMEADGRRERSASFTQERTADMKSAPIRRRAEPDEGTAKRARTVPTATNHRQLPSPHSVDEAGQQCETSRAEALTTEALTTEAPIAVTRHMSISVPAPATTTNVIPKLLQPEDDGVLLLEMERLYLPPSPEAKTVTTESGVPESESKVSESEVEATLERQAFEEQMESELAHHQAPTIDANFLENTSWFKGSLIGEGYSSNCFVAETKDGFEMVVKQISLTGADADHMRQKAINEVNILQKLAPHPNVVAVYGSVEESGVFNIFLEYMTGGSVASVIEELSSWEDPSLLSEVLIRRIIAQMIRALLHAHSLGIMHRDLKGDNVVVSRSVSIAKLCDFGEAVFLGSQCDLESTRKSPHGSIPFMAPEMLNKQPYDLKAEVWSLGCCMLEMAVGVHPWASRNYSESQLLYTELQGGLPTIPETLSESARDFILSCLQRDAAQRPTMAALSQHPFVSPYFQAWTKSTH